MKIAILLVLVAGMALMQARFFSGVPISDSIIVGMITLIVIYLVYAEISRMLGK